MDIEDGRRHRNTVLHELSDLKRTYPRGSHTCPCKKLWPILNTLLGHIGKHKGFFLVIDALDECHFDSLALETQSLLSGLLELSNTSSFRIAVFSRPNPAFSDFVTRSCRSINIDQRLNGSDIQLHVQKVFPSHNIPLEYMDAILKQIQKQAGGIFLWAEKLLDYLDEPCSDDDFVKRLHGCPPGLGPIFDKLSREGATQMSPYQKTKRKELYELLCEAAEPHSLTAIAKMLKLGRYDAVKNVTQIGKPLVEVNKGSVTFIHVAIKDWLTDESRLPLDDAEETLFVWTEKSHARIAKECLGCLLEPQYTLKGRIGQYLHRNYAESVMHNFGVEVQPLEGGAEEEDVKDVTYEYASNHWAHHLTRTLDPDDELLQLAQEFLHGLQFAHWSEYALYRSKNDFFIVRMAFIHLRGWFDQLQDDKKSSIRVDDYYVAPYEELSLAFKESAAEDRILQWLAQMQLARYFVDIGTSAKAIPVLIEVTKGLTKDFGSRHPLTLRARTDRAILYFQGMELREANRDFEDIAKIEEEDLGPDNPELYRTLLGRGGTEYLMNQYELSIATQDKAAWGFRKLFGEDDLHFLNTQVWLCLPLVEIGKLEYALEILSGVFQKRRKRYGAEDLYAAQVQHSIGDIYRKQGRRQDSLDYLREALAVKMKASPLSSIWSLDIAISLLIALREFGERTEALAMLNSLDQEAEVDRLFARFCQVNHLRALLFYEDGRKTDAITLLQGILIRADRHQYNRALLWIILDLSVLLRARKNEGDKKQAEALFNNVLVDLREGRGASGQSHGDPEPDPPRILRLAEQALKLVRTRKFADLQKLFTKEKVGWYRLEDLWISYGGPAADTGWMRGP